MSDTTENQIEIVLIRHGKTEGNKQKQYIGRTDQPLSEEGKAEIRSGSYPSVEKVYASPMLRTRQTAALIYPEQTPELVEGLREMDFGVFEGKSHAQLKHRPSYVLWIAARGKTKIPQGESMKKFSERTLDGFLQVVQSMQKEGIKKAAVVAHGGTIMAITSQLTGDDYYSHMVNNGGGYRMYMDAAGKLISMQPLLGKDNEMQERPS